MSTPVSNQDKSSNEPPEWFADLPEYMQVAWVRMGLAPQSWAPSGFSYAPEWAQQWQQAAWLGFAAPASLAPFYASTMYRTALRAGWLGDQGMYGYMGRAGEAGGQAQGYMTWAAEAQGPTQGYALSQASLWEARQAYWTTQQQWAPIAEAWGGARLASFAFPQFGLLRAFGFPFYSAAQRLTASAAMAPYIQQAIAQDPAALYRIQQSPMFWPGQYGAGGAGFGQTLLAQTVSGFGEWTAAQSIVWSIRGGGFNLGIMKETAAIQLMQAGLGLAIDPAMTLVARQMWGVPTTRQEYLEMGAQMGIGAGMFGAGVLAGRTWGFMPSLARASTASWAPFSIEEAISLQQFFTPERVLWAPNRTMFDAFLPTRSIIGGPQKWVQQAWNEAVDYPNAGVWATQRFSRLAALGRVTGSIIGGQVGFEIGTGLGTAYVDALARQGRDVGFERAVVPPLVGTAGLMVGSYLGATTPGGWSLTIPYATYHLLQAGMQPVPGPVPNVPWTYGQTTQAYRWNWENVTGGITRAVTQAPQDVWSYLQETAKWGPTLTPIYQMLDAIGNIGVTASIIQGYQRNPEMWAYGMRNVPGFGTWGGQTTFQDWAMRQYALNRVGTPFWQTQGYADWQMSQYGMRNVPDFGVRSAASEAWSGLPNWMYYQSGNMVQRRGNYAGVDFAAESVFYRTSPTGQLLGERIPWVATGGFWSPPKNNPYPVRSRDWEAYERAWSRATGTWSVAADGQLIWTPKYPATPYQQERSILQAGGTINQVEAAFVAGGMTPSVAEYLSRMYEHGQVPGSHPSGGGGGRSNQPSGPGYWKFTPITMPTLKPGTWTSQGLVGGEMMSTEGLSQRDGQWGRWEWVPGEYTYTPTPGSFTEWWMKQPDYVAGSLSDEAYYDLYRRWKGLPPLTQFEKQEYAFWNTLDAKYATLTGDWKQYDARNAEIAAFYYPTSAGRMYALLDMMGALEKRIFAWNLSPSLGNDLYEEGSRS